MAETRIDELRRRLERDPGSRLFAQLAEELRKAGDHAEAIRVARGGLAHHPVYASARLTLGRALLDSGDPAGARAELESALRDAPDNILASRFLAQARLALGDLRGAAEQFQRTLLMAPGDRQLQDQLAAVEARLRGAAGEPLAGGEATAPLPRGSAPPLLAGAVAPPGTPRAAAPPLVFAPSRPAHEPKAGDVEEDFGEGGALPPTLRIRSSQTAAPPPSAPVPPPPPPPAAAPSPAPAEAAPAPAPAVVAGPEPQMPAWDAADAGPVEAVTLPGGSSDTLGARVTEPAPSGADAPPSTPFSSSTLAELYFQQGLVDRAKDVYRQVLEQEPENDKARDRLAELDRVTPGADERALRRRALERTIAGLETLLAAVRRR